MPKEKELYEYDEEGYGTEPEQYEVNQHDSKSSFFPLGFLLVTLALGTLAVIAGGVLLNVGTTDLAAYFMGIGGIVAAFSFLFGVLESM
ncbi:MAG: hypothetical protein ABIR91_01350 [Candidatus Saccharimonadales bacterium]